MEVLVPRESVNDDSVIVQRVLVPKGTLVKAGEIVVDIETSKTTIEVTAPAAGRVQHDLSPGQEVNVGALLFRVADPDGATVAQPPTRAAIVAGADSVSAGGRDTASAMPPAAPALLSRAASAAAA